MTSVRRKGAERLHILVAANKWSRMCLAHFLSIRRLKSRSEWRNNRSKGSLPEGYDFFVATVSDWPIGNAISESPIVHSIGRDGAVFTVIRAPASQSHALPAGRVSEDIRVIPISAEITELVQTDIQNHRGREDADGIVRSTPKRRSTSPIPKATQRRRCHLSNRIRHRIPMMIGCTDHGDSTHDRQLASRAVVGSLEVNLHRGGLPHSHTRQSKMMK